MPRHKKTKEQKIKAEQRQKAEENVALADRPVDYSYRPTFTFSRPEKSPTHYTIHSQASSLFSDLKKTLITSTSIIVAELILFFLLQTHIK